MLQETLSNSLFDTSDNFLYEPTSTIASPTLLRVNFYSRVKSPFSLKNSPRRKIQIFNKTPFLYQNSEASKMRNEIRYLGKVIGSGRNTNRYTANRPMTSTKNTQFDFSCNYLIETSPTNKCLVSSKSFDKKKPKLKEFSHYYEQKSRNNFYVFNQSNKNDFISFINELSKYKKKRLLDLNKKWLQ